MAYILYTENSKSIVIIGVPASGVEDNSWIIFLISQSISPEPSLELSHRGGSNEESQRKFYGEICKIIKILPL